MHCVTKYRLCPVAGDLNQITSHTHPQMADPTFAAAARGQHRAEAQTPGGPAATNIPSGADPCSLACLSIASRQLRY